MGTICKGTAKVVPFSETCNTFAEKNCAGSKKIRETIVNGWIRVYTIQISRFVSIDARITKFVFFKLAPEAFVKKGA